MDTFLRCVKLTGRIMTNSSRFHHTLTGRCVSVKSERPTYCINFLRLSSQAVRHEHLVSVLQKCTSVQEQIEKLYETLRLTPEDVENRMDICRTIENVLKPFFPDCSIHLVGSSTNGLGIKGCDVDMSIHTCCDTEMISDNQFATVPSIEDVRDGTFPLKDLHCLPVKVQLLFIRNVLGEYCPHCKDLCSIAGRCRIIDFSYSKYNLNCDLSFNNQTAFYSTKLLHFYGKLDKRVPLLMVFLNYWGKRARIVSGITRFKSYAFSLLMIYFLQTRSPPVIPTVGHLFSKSDFFKSNDAWNYGVSPDIAKIEPSENTQSAEELLREFFFFCLYFDFTKAIRPLSGTAVDQLLLSISDEPGSKFEPNSISIEDPIDLTWNVTYNVSHRFLMSFIKSVLATCRLYQDETLWSSHSNNWGIIRLLDRNITEDLGVGDDTISFQIPSTFRRTHSLEQELDFRDICFKDNWLQKVSQAVLNVLEYGFLFKCTALEKGKVQLCCDKYISNSGHLLRKRGKISSTQTASYSVGGQRDAETSRNDDNMVMLLHCVAHNAWQGREECRKQLDSSDHGLKSVLEKEHNISLKMCQQKQSGCKQEFAFFCECSAEVNGELPVLNITLRSIDRNTFPRVLAIFLKEYVPNIVKSLV